MKDQIESKAVNSLSSLPERVRPYAKECEEYFDALLLKLEGFLMDRRLRSNSFFYGRGKSAGGYEGNTPVTVEEWELYFVAPLGAKIEPSEQSYWVDGSFYRGEGVRALVLHSSLVFLRGTLRSGAISRWFMLGVKPSKDSRLCITTNSHLIKLSSEEFADAAWFVRKTLEEIKFREEALAFVENTKGML